MNKKIIAGLSAAWLTVAGLAPVASSASAARTTAPLIEFELMTWPEVRDALAAGKTTALFYTGGVEQRGPQNANGGHNLMSRAIVKEIALQLGDAIAMPVLPFSPNRASAEFPGTLGLTNEILEVVLERLVEEAITTGFRNVVIMGDHGGGQGVGDANVYARVAAKLTDKYKPQGVQVFYCDDVYMPANSAFDKILTDAGYPRGFHGGLIDTSIMMYLDTDGTYVRLDQLPNSEGIPVGADGRPATEFDPKLRNGIVGDARRSSKELGKQAFDMKVDYAVKQIRQFIPKAAAAN